MTSYDAGFCPRCGTARVGVYRYCPDCAYDHAPMAEAPVAVAPPVCYAELFPRPGPGANLIDAQPMASVGEH